MSATLLARGGLVSLLLAAGLAAGCASTADRGNPVRVTWVGAGQAEVEGRRVDVAGLGRKVRAAGATSATPILVSVPDSAPPEALKSLTRSLSQAGFRRIVFVKPKRARVFVDKSPR